MTRENSTVEIIERAAAAESALILRDAGLSPREKVAALNHLLAAYEDLTCPR
jgi:hypothetical protein